MLMLMLWKRYYCDCHGFAVMRPGSVVACPHCGLDLDVSFAVLLAWLYLLVWSCFGYTRAVGLAWLFFCWGFSLAVPLLWSWPVYSFAGALAWPYLYCGVGLAIPLLGL